MELENPRIIQAPVTGCLEDALMHALEEDVIENLHFEGGRIRASLSSMELRSCRINGCSFSGCDFHKLQLTDVVFSGCDFSNAVLTEAVLHRVELTGCKLVGCKLGGAYLRNTLFSGCNLRYMALSKANLKAVRFQECDLEDAAITDSKFLAELRMCSLKASTWFSTALCKIDLSTCDIEGIRLTPAELKGALINQQQAAQLAHFLGVTVVF